MRFIGLVFVLASAAIAWFLGIKGTGNLTTDFNNMRTRLAQLLNLPGLAPAASSGAPQTPPPPTTTAGSGGSGFGPGAGAGQGVGGRGGGSF